MINREKFLQTAGSVLKHAMCSKREGSKALCGRNPAVLGLYSVAVHAAYPAGQPCARTIVLALDRTPYLSISELRSAVENGTSGELAQDRRGLSGCGLWGSILWAKGQLSPV